MTDTKPSRAQRLIGGIAIAVILAGLFIYQGLKQQIGPDEVVASYTSADEIYILSVWKTPRLLGGPDQGDEAPGRIVLTSAEGIILNRLDIEAVADASEPQWTTDRVTMNGLLDWELPKPAE